MPFGNLLPKRDLHPWHSVAPSWKKGAWNVAFNFASGCHCPWKNATCPIFDLILWFQLPGHRCHPSAVTFSVGPGNDCHGWIRRVGFGRSGCFFRCSSRSWGLRSDTCLQKCFVCFSPSWLLCFRFLVPLKNKIPQTCDFDGHANWMWIFTGPINTPEMWIPCCLGNSCFGCTKKDPHHGRKCCCSPWIHLGSCLHRCRGVPWCMAPEKREKVPLLEAVNLRACAHPW